MKQQLSRRQFLSLTYRHDHVLPERAGAGGLSTAAAHGLGRMTAAVAAGSVDRSRSLRRVLLVYVPLLILAIVALGPVLVLVFNSLKTAREIVQDPLGPPDAPQLANYARAWRQGHFESTMRNSAILTAGSVSGVCIISGLAACALGRLRVRGSRAVVTYLFLATTAPAPLYVIPLFFMWTRLGQINSLTGLIIIYRGVLSPFGTLLLRSFLLSLPPPRTGGRGAGGRRERTSGPAVHLIAAVVAGLRRGWPDHRARHLERVLLRQHLHSQSAPEARDDQFALVSAPVQQRPGVDQRRQRHCGPAGRRPVPAVSTSLHRRYDGERVEGLDGGLRPDLKGTGASNSACTLCGSDGIRTRDLHLDRVAC